MGTRKVATKSLLAFIHWANQYHVLYIELLYQPCNSTLTVMEKSQWVYNKRHLQRVLQVHHIKKKYHHEIRKCCFEECDIVKCEVSLEGIGVSQSTKRRTSRKKEKHKGWKEYQTKLIQKGFTSGKRAKESKKRQVQSCPRPWNNLQSLGTENKILDLSND